MRADIKGPVRRRDKELLSNVVDKGKNSESEQTSSRESKSIFSHHFCISAYIYIYLHGMFHSQYPK